MASLRLITWNCHHGSLAVRLAQLAPHADVAFVQECRPDSTPLLTGQALTRTINPRKGIALASLNETNRLEALGAPSQQDVAAVGGRFTGLVSFVALGIWAHPPDYTADALRTIEGYRELLRPGPSVVMGDLNSGTRLDGKHCSSRGHLGLVDVLHGLGLVSAYHAFHHVEHGRETHPTYHHRRHASEPWHIDFCFVPEAWAQHLVAVDVLDGPEWRAISDHLPLRVELHLPS